MRVVPGPSFARRVGAGRGGIAGFSGQDAAVAQRLAEALGPQGTSLSAAQALVVEADGCTLHGRPLQSAADWWTVVSEKAFGQVKGPFVLAYRDGEGAVHLVRDAVGHRTLYYAQCSGGLLFASRMDTLLGALGSVPRTPMRSVAMYLTYGYVPGPGTLLEGVFELLPGAIVSHRNGSLLSSSFWAIPPEPTEFEPEELLEARLRRELEAQVAAMVPREGPVTVSLSGGIDSSLVVALAQRWSSGRVHTFSITFGEEYKNELPYSSMVAAHCGTQHTVVELTPEAIVGHLDDTMALLGKPNGDPLTVPNALLFRAMAEHGSVALNGEGGDPCFGGPKNVPMVLAEVYGEAYGPSDSAVASRERTYLQAHQKCFDELSDLMDPAVWDEVATRPLEEDLVPYFQDSRWRGLVTKLLAINVAFKGGHHILPKVAALSVPFGVFPRSPLFAREVVELAFAIPPHAKLRGSQEKYLLKRAVRDLLPRAILERPKSGMMVPVEGWFSGPLLPFARERILEGLAPSGLFRRAYLEELLEGRLRGLRPRRGVKIWLLLALESHLRGLRSHGLQRRGAFL